MVAGLRLVCSAPAMKPPSSQGLDEFTKAAQGAPTCGCTSAVAAPIRAPMSAPTMALLTALLMSVAKDHAPG